jgi:hypothetical protein
MLEVPAGHVRRRSCSRRVRVRLFMGRFAQVSREAAGKRQASGRPGRVKRRRRRQACRPVGGTVHVKRSGCRRHGTDPPPWVRHDPTIAERTTARRDAGNRKCSNCSASSRSC